MLFVIYTVFINCYYLSLNKINFLLVIQKNIIYIKLAENIHSEGLSKN